MRGIIVTFSLVVAGAAVWGLAGKGNEPEPKKQSAKKPDKKAVKELMGRKLTHSQQLLGALVTNDLDKAGREAEALLRVRKEAAWMIYKTKDYEMWSSEFDASAGKIVKVPRGD